jgi:exonuclease VII small subunit
MRDSHISMRQWRGFCPRKARDGEAIDLFIDGTYDKAVLDECREQIEQSIEPLEGQRAELGKPLASLEAATGHARDLHEFAKQIEPKLACADQSSETQRSITGTLNVRAILTEEDGEQVVGTFCPRDEGPV